MSYKKDKTEIIIILVEIIKLLESFGSKFQSYNNVYKYFRTEWECVENEDEANAIRREILRTYTEGMGSFNDLVLCSYDKVLPEHQEFSKLKTKLFNTLLNQLH